MTANYITVSDVSWHGRTPASFGTTNEKMPKRKSQLLSAVGKPRPYLFQRQPWKRHDKLHTSVNTLCHCGMILIHAYVFIMEQLTNLKVSAVSFMGFCYFMLQNSNGIKYFFFRFYLKIFIESGLCPRVFGNNSLN